MNSLEIMPLRNKELDWQRINTFISFPETFRIFNDLFLINQLLNSDKAHYLDTKIDVKKALGVFKFRIKESIVVYNFYDPDEIPDQIELLMNKEEELDQQLLDQGYIPFAYCASEQLLFVATAGEKKEGIFLFSRWNDSPLELLAPNIFAFFHQFYLDIEEVDKVRFSKEGLIKNWGEDFWRINKGN